MARSHDKRSIANGAPVDMLVNSGEMTFRHRSGISSSRRPGRTVLRAISLLLAINISAATAWGRQARIDISQGDASAFYSSRQGSAPAGATDWKCVLWPGRNSGARGFAVVGADSAARGPSRDDARIQEINRLIDAGELPLARRKLTEEVTGHGESYQTLFLEAKILFREQKCRESLKVLERCFSLDQHDPELYKLVALNAILIDRMDIAEQALQTATRLAPHDSLVLFHLGALYYTESRFPSARPLLEKSVNLNPEYVPARLFLGLTLEELGQEQTAIDCYHRAIEMSERSGSKGEQPYLYLGRLLYRENRLNESLPYLRKAVQANSRSCESLCLVARVLSVQGQEADALAALRQCTGADPNYVEAHYLLSRAYVKQGRTGEAARELSLFQELKKLEENKKDSRKNQRARP